MINMNEYYIFDFLYMNVIVMVRIGNHVWEIVLLDNLGGWGVPARRGAHLPAPSSASPPKSLKPTGSFPSSVSQQKNTILHLFHYH